MIVRVCLGLCMFRSFYTRRIHSEFAKLFALFLSVHDAPTMPKWQKAIKIILLVLCLRPVEKKMVWKIGNCPIAVVCLYGCPIHVSCFFHVSSSIGSANAIQVWHPNFGSDQIQWSIPNQPVQFIEPFVCLSMLHCLCGSRWRCFFSSCLFAYHVNI